jgi:hypothetical protein
MNFEFEVTSMHSANTPCFALATTSSFSVNSQRVMVRSGISRPAYIFKLDWIFIASANPRSSQEFAGLLCVIPRQK